MYRIPSSETTVEFYNCRMSDQLEIIATIATALPAVLRVLLSVLVAYPKGPSFDLPKSDV